MACNAWMTEDKCDGGTCREGIIYWLEQDKPVVFYFDTDRFPKVTTKTQKEITEYMTALESYINRWNKYFGDRVKIVIDNNKKHIYLETSENTPWIIHCIAYSILRGDSSDYCDGTLLDYCIEHNIRLKDIMEYQEYYQDEILTLEDRYDNNEYYEISGPLDFFDYFEGWYADRD